MEVNQIIKLNCFKTPCSLINSHKSFIASNRFSFIFAFSLKRIVPAVTSPIDERSAIIDPNPKEIVKLVIKTLIASPIYSWKQAIKYPNGFCVSYGNLSIEIKLLVYNGSYCIERLKLTKQEEVVHVHLFRFQWWKTCRNWISPTATQLILRKQFSQYYTISLPFESVSCKLPPKRDIVALREFTL